MFIAPYEKANPSLIKSFESGAPGVDGWFLFNHPSMPELHILTIASNGGGWEHVSVSLRKGKSQVARCPRWAEMCFVKDQFWGKDDQVIQYHPKESEYINCHPFVLHLWRPIGVEIPSPPSIMVGPKQ